MLYNIGGFLFVVIAMTFSITLQIKIQFINMTSADVEVFCLSSPIFGSCFYLTSARLYFNKCIMSFNILQVCGLRFIVYSCGLLNNEVNLLNNEANLLNNEVNLLNNEVNLLNNEVNLFNI